MRTAALLFSLALAATAVAQEAVFVPDDFVDPRQRGGRPVFISRVVAGGAANFIDAFRPLGAHVGFIHVANNLYWRRVQFGFDHSEVLGGDRGSEEVLVCGCPERVRFTMRRTDGSPLSPLPSSKETLQASWYWPLGGGEGRIPIMLRSSVRWSHRGIDVVERSIATGEIVQRLSGRERTIAFDTDTYLRIRGREVFGSLVFASTESRGTGDDQHQRALTYTNRFPAWSIEKARALIQPTFTVGGATNRGGAAVNVISPAIEALWHHTRSRANVHVVWNPQWRANGENWKSTNQIAVFVDYAPIVKLF